MAAWPFRSRQHARRARRTDIAHHEACESEGLPSPIDAVIVGELARPLARWRAWLSSVYRPPGPALVTPVSAPQGGQ
jgi:hypothetical protein